MRVYVCQSVPSFRPKKELRYKSAPFPCLRYSEGTNYIEINSTPHKEQHYDRNKKAPAYGAFIAFFYCLVI